MVDKRYKWKPHHIEFIKKHQADMTRSELCELMKANFDDLPSSVSRNTLQLLINRRLKLKSKNDGVEPSWTVKRLTDTYELRPEQLERVKREVADG